VKLLFGGFATVIIKIDVKKNCATITVEKTTEPDPVGTTKRVKYNLSAQENVLADRPSAITTTLERVRFGQDRFAVRTPFVDTVTAA